MPKTPLEGVERQCEFHTIQLGCALQSLFSSLPDGLPGFGLLTLRLNIGISLIYWGATSVLVKIPAPVTVAQSTITAGACIFLLAGLWTPIICALATLDRACVAMLGPGHGRLTHACTGEGASIVIGLGVKDHPPKRVELASTIE